MSKRGSALTLLSLTRFRRQNAVSLQARNLCRSTATDAGQRHATTNSNASSQAHRDHEEEEDEQPLIHRTQLRMSKAMLPRIEEPTNRMVGSSQQPQQSTNLPRYGRRRYGVRC